MGLGLLEGQMKLKVRPTGNGLEEGLLTPLLVGIDHSSGRAVSEEGTRIFAVDTTEQSLPQQLSTMEWNFPPPLLDL